ncbi:ABC transporter substrate-binding protein [Aldersonia sp. NBC_00410]|uniref:ABC transporter substrate-binding protein n=1 Tax=Aldersonia sp. NBC_00410 TaxID=2975954 RepID=UPI00224FC632|nr:ABC transporter substrate-binding protein [Aldersonia sp. NBC_00410]MCX5044222.1 ABC transporter substrate-binding protein [Aldersonia sp. NBC_00410]
MKRKRIVVAVAAAALLLAGCSGRSGTETSTESDGGSAGASAVSADFGDLTDVCQSGSPKGSPTQGVTDSQIEVGVFSDVGFTKNSEFVDAAKVFTSWCNELGGINGRKLVANTRDSKLMETNAQMVAACSEDFALVGGGSALDGLGVKTRLNCGLPSFPAQTVQATATGADLQISASPSQTAGYDPYFQFRSWLMKEAYPASAGAIGIINGDSPLTKDLGAQALESVQAAGGTFVYNDLYPAMGVSDWTPYAQKIKSEGVKGLLFYGDYNQLVKLETVLTGMDYKLDWIDANNNAYNAQFLKLAGKSAEFQNNVLDLGGVAPLESDEPATKQVKELYKKYAPDAQITLPAIRAMSSWLLFAKAAASCGDDLTRTCVYNAAASETAWTGGGLTAPQNLAQPAPPSPCYNAEQATKDGWVAADFHPDNGPYRCDMPAYKYTQNYGTPMTLADVGKTMNDVK